MTHQSLGRKRPSAITFRLTTTAALLGLLLTGATATGCASTSRTNVSPSKTNATHETRDERPGRTKQREFELEILPPAQPHSSNPGLPANRDGEVAGLAAGRHSPSVNPASVVAPDTLTGDSIRVSDAPSLASLTRVAWNPESAVDPSIAQAIRQAVEAGSGVKLRVTDTDEIPLTSSTTSASLDDAGPGLQTSSDEAAIGFDGRKSGASLPWGGSSGKTKWGVDASLISSGVNALHIFGAIVMAASIIPIVTPPRRWLAAGIVASTGLLIIAAGTVSEEAPWVFVAAILAFLGVAGWLGYEAWRNKRRGIALESIATGVENADGNAVTKNAIAEAAGDNLNIVKSETTSVKNKLKLKKTSP